jgi:hypothetical protein
MAPEPISMVFFINPPSVCVSVSVICTPFIVTKQRFSKHVPAATNTRNTYELLDSSFSLRSVLYHRKVCGVPLCIPLPLQGNGSVSAFPRQRIHETRTNCWTRRFLCGPFCTKGKSVGPSARQWLVKRVPAKKKNCMRRRFGAVRVVTKEK